MNKLFKRLLEKRGIYGDFLLPEYEKMANPMILTGMKEAVERIKLAVKKQEKVLIYGDYDVDGVTASVVMYDALKLAGAKDIEVMLPNRFEDGYGMSEKVIKKAKEGDFSLVVTVDCGSANFEIIDKLAEIGVDTIVTDHHECGNELPSAVAVVNPKREENRGEFGDLAGVGVAFMVAKALVLEGAIKDGQEKWLLDLVIIGTICDSMTMSLENRRLAYWGMKVIEKTRRKGLKELMNVAGVKKINSDAIGFQIGPRLNAAGRMASAEIALKLLMTDSQAEAAKLAGRLDRLNLERKKQQQQAVLEVENSEDLDKSVIVAIGDWHEGILGIIAGRLVEKYQRPAFVLTEVDGIYKGSGRSFGDFNLAEALDNLSDVIISGGGHAGACGVKIEKDKLDDFKNEVNKFYKSLGLFEQERFLEREADLVLDDFSDLTMELYAELRQLEPYGEGNLEPLWLLDDVLVMEAIKMGADLQHLRLLVCDKNNKSLKLVAFYAPEKWLKVKQGDRVKIWITLVENEWNGLKNIEGKIEKIGVEDFGDF